MDSENDGNLTFFPGHESKNLDDIAKDFSDFGPRNPHDTPANQAIWYNDRLQLMRELGSALGQHGKSMISPHMESIQEKIDKLKSMSGGESTLPTQVPNTPNPVTAPAAPPKAKSKSIKQKVKPQSVEPPIPEASVKPQAPAFRYPKPEEINQSDNAYRPPTPKAAPPTPSPYGKKGREITDRFTSIPKGPTYYQMRGKNVAASQFKNMEMIQIEADLRNCLIETLISLGENVSHPVTKEFLLHINKSKMQKISKL
jgi:hypothetical protein